MKYFEIEVSLKNGHSNQVFNHSEGVFVKDASEGTYYATRADAEADLERARAAWNEYDSMEVVERDSEIEE